MTPAPSPRRFLVLGFTSIAALWMYVDRVCLSTLADRIQTDLGFDGDAKAHVVSAFFLAYALCQLPAGTLADRYGPRRVLTACMVGWSLVTVVTGFVNGFVTLFAARLLLGIAEAGAYPAAAGLIKSWAGPGERGRFSSLVALGGRGGGAVAPYVTAALAVALIGWGPAAWSAGETNWRAVFVVFGGCGLLVAAAFWLAVRDRPPAGDGSAPPEGRPLAGRLAEIVRDRNMTLFAVVQLGVNVGWAFLVTLLPTFLNEAFGTPLKEIGAMQSTALLIGCAGMLLGGYAADALHRRLGPKRGRSLPIGGAMLGCVACCCLVTRAGSAWDAILVLGVMAFLVDLSNPSIWAFAQDVGGRTVGTALGWGNMWGNLGAYTSPILLTRMKTQFGWDAAFLVCAGAFAVAAVCGFLLDAGRPISPSRKSTST